jgi:Tol biopolymer transport system component
MPSLRTAVPRAFRLLAVLVLLFAVSSVALPHPGAGAMHAGAAQSEAAEFAIAQIRCRPCQTGIALIDASGGRARSLTRRSGWQDDDPAWSPDGERLAFTRTTDDYRSLNVYVMRADGRGVRRLTSGRFDERPSWSPDGRWIAYQSTRGIKLIHPDGSGARRVRGTRGAAWPAWAPDGSRLAFADDGWIWTADLDGRARRRIVRGRDPDWSPDGRVIAYVRSSGGVATIAAAGGASRHLGRGLQPDWSPDGSRIAFARWPASGRFSVWVMNADGGDRQLVTRSARSPAWRTVVTP